MKNYFTNKHVCNIGFVALLIILPIFGCSKDFVSIGEPMHWNLIENSDPEAVSVTMSKVKDNSDNITIEAAPIGGTVKLECLTHNTFSLPEQVPQKRWKRVTEYSNEWLSCRIKDNVLTLELLNEEADPMERDFTLYITDIETETKIRIIRHK